MLNNQFSLFIDGGVKTEAVYSACIVLFFYLSAVKHLIGFCLVLCAGPYYTGAQTFSGKDFTELKWINGTWKMPVKNGFLYEQWHTLNDSTLQSRGFMVKTFGDTVLLEAVQIRFRNNRLYYVPTVNGQNNNEPVTFIITSTTGQSFTAENPAHDFPQKIYYRCKPDATLYAAVSGNKKGIAKKEEFNFTKE